MLVKKKILNFLRLAPLSELEWYKDWLEEYRRMSNNALRQLRDQNKYTHQLESDVKELNAELDLHKECAVLWKRAAKRNRARWQLLAAKDSYHHQQIMKELKEIADLM